MLLGDRFLGCTSVSEESSFLATRTRWWVAKTRNVNLTVETSWEWLARSEKQGMTEDTRNVVTRDMFIPSLQMTRMRIRKPEHDMLESCACVGC